MTLLTERSGSVSVMARSARKSAKRFQGALEPFGVIDAEIVLGASEVGRLGSARLVRGFPAILASLPAMAIAGRALELVRDATPPRESEPDLLEAVIELFEALCARPDESARVAFVIRYLALLGLAPQLESCGKCGKRPGDGRSSLFDPASGSIVCRACGGGPLLVPASTRALMSQSIDDGWTRSLATWTHDDVITADEVLDAFIGRHVPLGKKR